MVEEFVDIDDDLIASSKVVEATVIPVYWPKYCRKEWFGKEVNPEDPVEVLQFRAYWAFGLANYPLALTLYQELLSCKMGHEELRCVTESIARCLLHLGRVDESLKIAIDVNKSSKSRLQKICILRFLLKIYHQRKDYSNVLITSANLILYQPTYMDYWFEFAEAFTNHWEISCSEETQSLICSSARFQCPADGNSEGSLLTGLDQNMAYHIIGACQTRIGRMYGRYFKPTWGHPDKSHMKATADKWLSNLPLNEDFQQAANKAICRDVGVTDKNDPNDAFYKYDETEDEVVEMTDDLTFTNHSLFYTRWFGWLGTYLDNNSEAIPETVQLTS